MPMYSGLIEGLSFQHKKPFFDERGYFYEKYNRNFLLTKDITFVQENISMSLKGTIRGLHWQSNPHAQDKLVTCISGEIFDVAVDIRKNSKTFGFYSSQILKGEENSSFWIPKGFAHGFQALTDKCILSYSVSSDYSASNSQTINPRCPLINVEWPLNQSITSINDKNAKNLEDLIDEEIFFYMNNNESL
jgi:dTDP-4-dehydrorhamnose 3,5-epimerase